MKTRHDGSLRHPVLSVCPTPLILAAWLAGHLGGVAAAEGVNGTSGTPLGGFGAGAVKFNANDGSFAAMTLPPADAHDFRPMKNARFQLFVQRDGEVQTIDPMMAATRDGRPEDDAIWPMHFVRFAAPRDVEVKLSGFSPLDRTDTERMSLPYAFFELSLENTGDSEAVVGCALQWDVGKATPQRIPGIGFTSPNWAVAVSAEDARVSVGNGTQFLDTGSGDGVLGPGVNRVAATTHLGPGAKTTCRFVLAWHDSADPENCHYLGLYDSPEPIARLGLERFESLKRNAEKLIDGMRSSNLPSWLTDQTLNTLANLTTNSMFKRDGRVAFAEGQWTCFGTMDQMWHARQIVGQLLPRFAWQELDYWARTQRADGQIHHDFNLMEGTSSKEERSALVAWDDTEHADYRNIDKWVDLNCAFIISVYELYQITGDRARFDELWPHVERAGRRILDQVERYGSREYPFTFDDSENSYDAGGDPNPFNASLSAVAYRIMAELASERGEKRIASTFRHAYETVVDSYRKRYLKQGFRLGKHAEGYFAGQWLGLHLKLGEIWSAAETDRVLDQLNTQYHPYHTGLGHPAGTYDEWTPYILVHYAGLLLNTDRVEQWRAMQYDSYTRWYHDRENVFNHPLDILPQVETPRWTSKRFDSGKQYISLPGLWRNYYDLIGYHRDERSHELWLKPVLPAELGHELRDAMYVSPRGYGRISCRKTGSAFQNREIRFVPESPTPVGLLHLTDDYGDSLTVEINGRPRDFERRGTGYARELVIGWHDTVGPAGLHVVVTGKPGPPAPPLPAPPAEPDVSGETGELIDAYGTLRATAASKSAGTTVVERKEIRYVSSCNNFDYIHFTRVDFGDDAATGFVAKVRSLSTGATLEVVLDSVSGEQAGTVQIPAPTRAGEWTELRGDLRPTRGTHDVVLRFFGSSSSELLDLESIRFTREAAVAE